MFEIGTTLRDARVRGDISLQQAENDTKIRVKYIQAMENEDFDALPGGTYAKGFLRTYAEYLGLDYQVVLDEYNERYGSGEHREHIVQPAVNVETPAAPRSPHSQKNRNYALVAILALAIIAVLAYLGWGNEANNEPTVITTTAEEEGTPTAPEVAPPAPPPTPTQTQTVPTTLETLVLASTETDNWVEIRREGANGPVIWGGTMSPGESQSFDKAVLGGPKVWLKVGSATGLQVVINGKPQNVPREVGATYVISAEGMSGQG